MLCCSMAHDDAAKRRMVAYHALTYDDLDGEDGDADGLDPMERPVRLGLLAAADPRRALVARAAVVARRAPATTPSSGKKGSPLNNDE